MGLRHSYMYTQLLTSHSGFTGGNAGATSGLDTGNLASREDVVGVEIGYRLSTLGFLAVPGTDVKVVKPV